MNSDLLKVCNAETSNIYKIRSILLQNIFMEFDRYPELLLLVTKGWLSGASQMRPWTSWREPFPVSPFSTQTFATIYCTKHKT